MMQATPPVRWRNERCADCGTPRSYRSLLHESVCITPRSKGEPWFGELRRQEGLRRGVGKAWCFICSLPWWVTLPTPGQRHQKALDRHIVCFRIFAMRRRQ